MAASAAVGMAGMNWPGAFVGEPVLRSPYGPGSSPTGGTVFCLISALLWVDPESDLCCWLSDQQGYGFDAQKRAAVETAIVRIAERVGPSRSTAQPRSY